MNEFDIANGRELGKELILFNDIVRNFCDKCVVENYCNICSVNELRKRLLAYTNTDKEQADSGVERMKKDKAINEILTEVKFTHPLELIRKDAYKQGYADAIKDAVSGKYARKNKKCPMCMDCPKNCPLEVEE